MVTRPIWATGATGSVASPNGWRKVAPRTDGYRSIRLCDGDVMTVFDDLLAEAEAQPVEGWDFSWFNGRATEERPSWGYARMMAERMGRAGAALDIQTGCGG